MTQKSLKLLHCYYNEAVKQSRNILDIQNFLYNLVINSEEFPEEDLDEIDSFILKLKNSIQIRQYTFKMTNLCSDLAFVVMYIALWVNSEKKLDVDINLTARRKALESELIKFLRKDEVHDLFGVRIILLNDISPEESEERVLTFSKYVYDIFTHRRRVAQFQNWVEESTFIDKITKERILFTLDLPFRVCNIKDYISNPKDNGYKSFHFVLGLEMYSPILPGSEIEFQLRNNDMNQHAANGPANHDAYKAQEEDSYKDVFKIDSFEGLKVVGLTSYNSAEDDLDGIHVSKKFLNRHISDSVVSIS